MTHAPDARGEGHELPELRLKAREDRRLAAGHLWIFSIEVDTDRTPLSGFATGALCRVVGDRDRFMGYAYVNPHARICAPILSRDGRFPPGKSLFVHRLQIALALRERLYPQPFYRLVYGESDGLPGLVLDRYGDVIVGQIGTAGMEALKGGRAGTSPFRTNPPFEPTGTITEFLTIWVYMRPISVRKSSWRSDHRMPPRATLPPRR